MLLVTLFYSTIIGPLYTKKTYTQQQQQQTQTCIVYIALFLFILDSKSFVFSIILFSKKWSDR